MNMNRFLRVQAGRVLLVATTLCTLHVMTEKFVMAHGEDLSETNPLPSSPSHSSNPSPLSSSKSAGLQAACWALTIPYGAAKMVYAISGGLMGSLAWAMTGGNIEVAKSLWIPSMTGDYIIQPQHLTREECLSFVGVPSESGQP